MTNFFLRSSEHVKVIIKYYYVLQVESLTSPQCSLNQPIPQLRVNCPPRLINPVIRPRRLHFCREVNLAMTNINLPNNCFYMKTETWKQYLTPFTIICKTILYCMIKTTLFFLIGCVTSCRKCRTKYCNTT